MKTAIVTGSSGNMGQAVVKKFLAEGYRVTGTVIPDDPVKMDISGSSFKTSTVDLMNEKAAAEMVRTVISESGSIEAAILTVGGFAMGTIIETSSADILKQYRLNFESAYHVARPVLAQMKKQGSGRIFMIGSRPGLDMHKSAGTVGYGLAKSLIFRLAELMNEETKKINVVTSVIIPSTIDTPQNRAAMPDADFTTWVKPEAIADVIWFYCSPAAATLREPLIKIYGNA